MQKEGSRHIEAREAPITVGDLQKRNPAIWQDFFAETNPHLIGYAFGFVRNREAAVDIVHEAWLKFSQKLFPPKEEENNQPLRADLSPVNYLRTTVRNTAFSSLRRKHVEERYDAALRRDSRPLVTFDLANSVGVTDEIRSALQKLPRREHEVFVMRFLGYSPQEVATKLGITSGAEKAYYSRGRNALRKLLSE